MGSRVIMTRKLPRMFRHTPRAAKDRRTVCFLSFTRPTTLRRSRCEYKVVEAYQYLLTFAGSMDARERPPLPVGNVLVFYTGKISNQCVLL